jgi:Cu2+-exporting ATPase
MPALPPATHCRHCQLPVGRFGEQQEVNGEPHWFCCYGCSLAYQAVHGAREEPEAAALLIRLGIGGFLAMNIMLFSLLLYADGFAGDVFNGSGDWLAEWVPWLLWALATPLLAILGGPFIGGAWRAARAGRLSADTLVSLGALAAYGFSALQVMRGSELVYFDTVTMVLLLFTLGRTIEAQGRLRALRSLAPMLAAEQAPVRVVRAGSETTLTPDQVRPGDRVRVRPGERIPVDGTVLEGRSTCDESLLTGQPAPQAKAPGDRVHAGSLNGCGQLLLCVVGSGGDTRWIRISRLVQSAIAQKSLSGEMVDRVTAWFIPGVLLLAAATVWFWAAHGSLEQALLTGLAVLVVACPCSLGLAAPLAMSLGIARAAQRGVLLRGGAVLEKLASLRGVAFDKTGTLSQGRLRALALASEGVAAAQIVARARALAQGSDHPVARAIVAMPAEPGDTPQAARSLQAHPGAGLSGEIDSTPCAMGSAAFMRTLGWDIPPALTAEPPAGATLVYVGWAGRVHGRLLLADAPRPEAAAVVAALRVRGVDTLLLSGDGKPAVADLARGLGIAVWHAELGPEAKVARLADWRRRHGAIAMVGDGLNDGPVLAAASVGIAVGGASDLARESADVVLPVAGLAQLPWLLQLAGEVRRSVRTNLLWAFGYNAVALTLAATGLLQPVLAAALMAGSSLLVVGRSLLASRRDAARDADPVEVTAREQAVAMEPSA